MWTFSLWTPPGSVLCVLLFCLTGSVSAAEPPAGSYVVKSFSYLSVLSVCGSYFRLCRAVDLHTVCRVVFILTERMHRSVQTDPSDAIKNRLRGYSPQSRAESRAERRGELLGQNWNMLRSSRWKHEHSLLRPASDRLARWILEVILLCSRSAQQSNVINGKSVVHWKVKI